MVCASLTQPRRRYLVRLVATMAVYLLFTYITRWSFQHLHPAGLRVYLLAMLPALPMVGSLAVVGLYVAEESDEFERSILVQSILWGLGGALSVSTICGALEEFAGSPHRSAFYSYLFFWIFMAISGAVIRLRYR